MKKEKRKRTTIKEVIVYILQQVFANTVGSWGAFIVDEDGNFIDYDDESQMPQCFNFDRIKIFNQTKIYLKPQSEATGFALSINFFNFSLTFLSFDLSNG